MFSTRSTAAVISLGLLVGGCVKSNQVHPAPLNRTPVPVDGAMMIRDWPQSTALYPNGAAVAGPTDFTYEPKADQSDWSYYYADTGTWLLNMLLLPYYGFATPQWDAVTYHGEVVQTTYTGQPPLPPQKTPAYVPKGVAALVPPPAPAPQTKPATVTTTAKTPAQPATKPPPHIPPPVGDHR